ncbi:MAG: hypothetical protein KDB00_09070, partial [Planctomycetales bacterium]|nr:hypothetical protein [Planctomycetales bacterium]
GPQNSILLYNDATPLDLVNTANVAIDSRTGVDTVTVFGSQHDDVLSIDQNLVALNSQPLIVFNVETLIARLSTGDDLVDLSASADQRIEIEGGDGHDQLSVAATDTVPIAAYRNRIDDGRTILFDGIERTTVNSVTQPIDLTLDFDATLTGITSVGGTFQWGGQTMTLATGSEITILPVSSLLPPGFQVQLDVVATALDDTINVTDSRVEVVGRRAFNLNSISGVHVLGGSGNDTINVTPSAGTEFYVDGGFPIGFGDVLNVVSSAATHFPGPENDEGTWVEAGMMPVMYDHIEQTQSILGNPARDIMLALPVGGANNVVVRRSGDNLHIVDDNSGVVLDAHPLAMTHSLTISGAISNPDSITIDYQSGGYFDLAGGIYLSGGADVGDLLIVLAAPEMDVEHSTSVVPAGAPILKMRSNGSVSELHYDHFETIDLRDLRFFSALDTFSIGPMDFTIDAEFPVNLGSVTSLAGGTLRSSSPVTLATAESLIGYGTVDGEFIGGAGSLVSLSGNLAIGDVASPAGFSTDGTINVAANELRLFDANQAILGALTVLGNASAAGTLRADNGLVIDFGNDVTGFGTIDTPNQLATPLMHNGSIAGLSSIQAITLKGYIRGVGSLGNVNVGGTYSPGFSPAAVTNAGMSYASESTLIVELGGYEPGSNGYDQLAHFGAVNLSGTLDIRQIDGFGASVGDRFTVMTAQGGISGMFDHLRLPPSPLGAQWDIFQTSHQMYVQLVDLAEVVGLELRAIGSSSASDQRSTISRVEVEFDGNVDIADNAFALTERRTGRAVQTNVQERPLANGNTVVELSFSGALTRGVGALVDGDYQLVIDSSQVTRVGSNVTLDGDGDGLVGGNYQFGNVAADRFFALYGDQDGDGDVDAQDMGRFALSFMKQSSDPAFDPVWDFDGDGDVDGNDLGQLELRLYRRL